VKMTQAEGKIVDDLIDVFFLIKKLDPDRKERMAEVLEIMYDRTFEKGKEGKNPMDLV